MSSRRIVLAALVSSCLLAVGALLSVPVALAATPPVIEEASVLDAASTSATLQATINPEGSETTYRFEYGTSEAYGSSIPVPDALVGSGSAGVTVSVHIQGLVASTAYHYRVVASVPSRSEAVDGTDGSFTTQSLGGAFALPDGRQWELASPPNKHGAGIVPILEGVLQAADDGSALTYITRAPTELEPQGYAQFVQVLSQRGARGWSSKDIATPHSGQVGITIGQGFEYRFFSQDLSLALVEPRGPYTPLSSEETEGAPDIRHDSTCEAAPAACYTPLVTAANVPPGTKFDPNPEFPLGGVEFLGATPNMSHVVLQAQVGLTSTPGDKGGLYEWNAGHLQLVSVLPEAQGGAPTFGSLGGTSVARHAISNDGSRIFWRAASAGEYPHLYMRDTLKGETMSITAKAPILQTASSDGSRVFFTESEKGTLEECDVVEAAGKLACNVRELAPNVQGAVLGASEDGSYVYFVSNSVLAAGAVSGTCNQEAQEPPSVSCNLYAMHNNGSSWEAPKLVAVLSAYDHPDWSVDLSTLTARVSPNGHWLAFMSQRSLTGYDNRDAVSGKADQEVYLYNSETEKLVCASCDPTGARPVGAPESLIAHGALSGQTKNSNAWVAASIPGWTPYRLGASLYQSRYLSDSGRLFFNSSDALVPQDVNGTRDVYEFEPEGVGGCTGSSRTFDARAGGCAGLISAGTSPEESGFVDASATGEDVFFMTLSHLSTEDFDTAFDMYDAHACSAAAPCYTPPVSPPPCTTGDACKAAPSPQPTIFGSPSSATFSGAGNVIASPSKPGASSRSLTQARKLARALRACRKKPRAQRGACERKARRQYRATQSRNAKATTKGNG